jgi:hypothetical protein
MAGRYGSSSSTSRYGPPPKRKKKQKDEGGGGLFGKVTGGLGNLAHDVGALKGIPMGLVAAGSYLGKSAMAGPKPLWTKEGQAEMKKARPFMPDQDGGIGNWLWPMLPGTKGGVGEGFHRMYEHPLAPILDIATIATFGAGAAARTARLLGPSWPSRRSRAPWCCELAARRTARSRARTWFSARAWATM